MNIPNHFGGFEQSLGNDKAVADLGAITAPVSEPTRMRNFDSATIVGRTTAACSVRSYIGVSRTFTDEFAAGAEIVVVEVKGERYTYLRDADRLSTMLLAKVCGVTPC